MVQCTRCQVHFGAEEPVCTKVTVTGPTKQATCIMCLECSLAFRDFMRLMPAGQQAQIAALEMLLALQ